MNISTATIERKITVNSSKSGGAPGSSRSASISSDNLYQPTAGTGANQLNQYWDDSRTIVAATSKVADPVAAPAAVGASSGSSIPPATYYIAYTFVCSAGVLSKETLLSPTVAVTTTGTQNITVTLPALATNAASINVYIGTTATNLQLLDNTAPTSYSATALPAASAALKPLFNCTGTMTSDSLNFTATLTDAFGDTLSALGIKHISVKNTSSANWLVLGGLAASTFPLMGAGPNGVNQYVLVPPGGEFDLTAFALAAGIPIVSGLNDVLKVTNPGSASVTYTPIVGMKV